MYYNYLLIRLYHIHIYQPPGSGGGNDYTSTSCGTDQVRYTYILYYYAVFLCYILL